jgi:hypothetical protein
MSGSALSSSRRARELTRLADHPRVDLLVVGGGVTAPASRSTLRPAACR